MLFITEEQISTHNVYMYMRRISYVDSTLLVYYKVRVPVYRNFST